MAPRDIGSQTDPSTLSGGGQNPSELGGGSGLQLLEEKNPQAYIDQLEFSEPSSSAPTDIVAVWDDMDGSGTADDPKVVTNDQELQAIENDLTAYYELANNIDCSGTVNWNGGDGFKPITELSGQINGNGHVISGLYVAGSTSNKGLVGSMLGSAGDVSSVLEDLVIYDMTIRGTGDTYNAGFAVGSFTQNAAPDERRIIVRDVLVLNSKTDFGQTRFGGITAYTSITGEIRRCAVVGCKVSSREAGSFTNYAGIAESTGAYDWGSDANDNFNVIEDCLSYRNEFSVPGGEGAFVLFATVASNSDIDSDAEYQTTISNCVAGENKNSSVAIKQAEESGSTADYSNLSITSFYHTDSIEGVGAYPDGTPSGAQLDINSVSNDLMLGESASANLPDLDFSSRYTTVQSNTDLPIYADGYPVLDGDYNRLQAAAQGLGDPLKADIKGITAAGDLVNVNSVSDIDSYKVSDRNTPPVGQSLPSNTRVGSSFQGFGGTFHSIPDTPRSTGPRYTTVKDPQDPKNIIKLGGEYTNDAGANKTILQTYNVWNSEYIEGKYPDPSDEIAEISDDSLINKPISGVIGDTIVLAGGEASGATNALNSSIYLLDTSASTPSWTTAADSLPEGRVYAGHAVYDGKLYIFGGNDGTDVLSSVITFDPSAASGEQIDTTPTDLPEPLEDSSNMPVVDGVVYIAGYWYTTESTRPIYTYDIEADSYTRIRDISGLLYSGESSTTAGTGYPPIYEYNGYVYVHSGYNYHGKVDVTAFSIEDQEWIPIPPDVPVGPGDAPISNSNYSNTMGTKEGKRFGNTVVFPGTDAANTSTELFILPEDPRDVKQ